MRTLRDGQLVTVTEDGVALPGIVFHAPSFVKVEVAVPDEEHGAVFRTVHPRALTARTAGAESDAALRRLIRRTPAAGSGGPGGGAGPGRRARGHTRTPAHRSGNR